MLDVYFESNKEVMRFCECLFYYNRQIEVSWRTHKEWGNHIKFKENFNLKDIEKVLVDSLVDVFIEHRLPKIITEITRERYYYENDAEIERILDISLWILTGKDTESVKIRKDINLLETIKSLFMDNINNDVHLTAIHFDSIVKFRIQSIKKELTEVIGLAIDEYKREEEHQAFTQTLREYITHKKPEYEEIYVLQADPFVFFKANGTKFTNIELRNLIEKEPLYMFGLMNDEWNLAPLIAMSPKNIKIYGEDPAEPKTLTVINIFQEKAVFLTKNYFPF